MHLRFLLFSWLLFFSFFSAAQTEYEINEEQQSESSLEFVITSNYAYTFSTQSGIFVTEGNITYWLTETFGVGASFVMKFEEENTFNDLPLLMSIKPNNWITINLGPNLELPKEERAFGFGAYMEAEFNFELAPKIHTGPIIGTVLGSAFESNFGIHFGFEF